MTLDEFMRKTNIKAGQLAGRIGCTAEAVRLWRRGTMPQSRFWPRITKATNGAVAIVDLFEESMRSKRASLAKPKRRRTAA